MRSKFFTVLLFVTGIFFNNKIFAQAKVVIMGSSTASGSGATSYELSWAGRLEGYFNQNTSDGRDTIFYNIAKAGYNSYQEMPTSFVPPSGKPAPDPLYNITKALSYNPDIIIINLPSNDLAAGFSVTETMNNFRMMYSCICANGVKCYFTTTQPRNDFSLSQRRTLCQMVDSINAQFGFFAINFWNDLKTLDGLDMLRDDRRDPSSQIHPNDTGHNFLFQRVKDKNIFHPYIFPVRLSNLNATLKTDKSFIAWHMDHQVPNTIFSIERSINGFDFTPLGNLNTPAPRLQSDYIFTDKVPLPGINFYRIKVSTAARTFYSGSISVNNNTVPLTFSKLFYDHASSNLVCDINTQKNGDVYLTIINSSGAILQQKKQYINTQSSRIVLPLPNLISGQYFIKVSTPDKTTLTKGFIK